MALAPPDGDPVPKGGFAARAGAVPSSGGVDEELSGLGGNKPSGDGYCSCAAGAVPSGTGDEDDAGEIEGDTTMGRDELLLPEGIEASPLGFMLCVADSDSVVEF